MNYRKISKCRVCKNPKLTEIGSLGMIAVSDFTVIPSEGTRMPLELVYCQRCTLLQLAHNFNRNLLYKNYWYESHINKTIVNDLKEIAKYSKGKITHIDIGGNDGTMLKYSKALNRISVDPSNIKPEKFEWINDYWEEAPLTHVNVDLITAIACLYDLPNPNKFIKKIYLSLSPDGVFIAQFQPLAEMVELNDVGNICHEHLEYYSYKSLVNLYERNGLEIFKVEKNKINGGSYRIFARYYQKGSIKFKEKTYGVRELKSFMNRIEESKHRWRKEVMKLIKQGSRIYGYGASTKANTIMQYYGTYPTDIIDVNPKKKGLYTIASKAEIIDKIPEEVTHLWVFPYGFIEGFKKREKGYKGKWVTTIPKFKIS